MVISKFIKSIVQANNVVWLSLEAYNAFVSVFFESSEQNAVGNFTSEDGASSHRNIVVVLGKHSFVHAEVGATKFEEGSETLASLLRFNLFNLGSVLTVGLFADGRFLVMLTGNEFDLRNTLFRDGTGARTT